MKRRHWFAVALVAPLLAVVAAAPWRGYDEAADARAEIARALPVAAASGRKLLLVFGANWCGDCRVLDLAMKEGALQRLIERDFVVVKVDVGRFDRNTDLAAAYGVPLKKGIPTVAVLDAAGRLVFVTSGGELADARNMGEPGLLRFFDRPW